MIRITEIIALLRNEATNWSVDGAVNKAIAKDDSRLPLPALYVGLSSMVYTKVSQSTYLQDYVENFFVLSCTPTTLNDDKTGKYAQDYVPIIRQKLMSILVNYKGFDPDSHVVMLERDQPEDIDYDRARYYHRFDFSITGRIDPTNVRPLVLDYFDTLTAQYVVDQATDDTPPVEQTITPLYFTTDT